MSLIKRNDIQISNEQCGMKMGIYLSTCDGCIFDESINGYSEDIDFFVDMANYNKRALVSITDSKIINVIPEILVNIYKKNKKFKKLVEFIKSLTIEELEEFYIGNEIRQIAESASQMAINRVEKINEDYLTTRLSVILHVG